MSDTLDDLVDALGELLADHEETARRSYMVPGRPAQWREEWRTDDPADYALCQRARAALAKADRQQPKSLDQVVDDLEDEWTRAARICPVFRHITGRAGRCGAKRKSPAVGQGS